MKDGKIILLALGLAAAVFVAVALRAAGPNPRRWRRKQKTFSICSRGSDRNSGPSVKPPVTDEAFEKFRPGLQDVVVSAG